MPHRELTNEQDCMDFITGLLFFGTGGGGSAQWGLSLLRELLDEGYSIQWVDIDDIPDGALTCTAYGTGSISEDVPDTEEEIRALGEKKGLPYKWGSKVLDHAVIELEEYVGKKIQAIIPAELGAGNLVAALATGIRLGKLVADGDYGGRAYPEEMQSTLFLKGVAPFPLAIVDWWGDILLLKEACNSAMMERIGKMLSVAAYGGAFVAASLLDGRSTKRTIIPNSLTRSLEVGRSIRLAAEDDNDPVKAALESAGGWLLFEGVVQGKEWEDMEGLMVGTTHIAGQGRFAGKVMEIYFKNENQATWINGEPYVCSPDLVSVLDRDTGIGLTNTEIEKGQEVAVVGTACNSIFRSEEALAWCGPRYFGLDIEYKPIEDLVS